MFEFQIILDLIMVSIGIPANIMILFVSIYNFHKSQSETILLINLALADLLQLRNEFSKRNTWPRLLKRDIGDQRISGRDP